MKEISEQSNNFIFIFENSKNEILKKINMSREKNIKFQKENCDSQSKVTFIKLFY